MLTVAFLAGPWPRLGVVVAALLAAATIVVRSDRRKAAAMLGALILAPVLLLDDVWHSSQLHFVHAHPLEAVIGGALALGVLGLAALVMHRWPWLLAPLAVLTLPFRVPVSTSGTTNYLLLPLYAVIAASALAWLVPVLLGRREPTPQRHLHLFEWLLAASIVLYALQALYSPAASGFPKALQNEAFFYIPFAVLFDRLRDVEWNRAQVVRCLVVTVSLALLFSVVGYVEELTRQLLPLFSSKVVSANQLHEYFTVNAVFFDPNIFGRYLALAMVLLATVLLYDNRARVQAGAVIALAMILTCMVFTLSRSSVVALGAGLAVIAALRWRARPVIFAGLAVLVLGVLIVAVHPSTFGLNQGFNGATDGRADLISGGLNLFSRRPLFGFGSGSFTPEYKHYFPISARAVSDSHNIPVTVASEQGLVGLLLYLGLLVSALATLLRGVKGDAVRVGVAAALVALLVHTMFYADWLEDPTTWVLLSLGATLASAAQARASSTRRERRRSPAVA
ncbi:MAG: O-antigen ligase family protein [Solirubrobacteraceae bacterium]